MGTAHCRLSFWKYLSIVPQQRLRGAPLCVCTRAAAAQWSPLSRGFKALTDLTCTLHSLHIYPLKSCAGIAVQQGLLIETGLELDRAWMLVDEQSRFLSQRVMPRMALIEPTLRVDDLRLRAPGMLALHLALDRVETATRVTVWNDRVDAYDMGPLAAQWFSDFLGRKVRLVRFDPEQQRRCDPRWTGANTALCAFADGFSLLVTSTASLAELNRRLTAAGADAVDMRRFRPNIVLDGIDAHDEDHIDTLHIATDQGPVVLKFVKPCVRCSIPDVDPATAETGFAVADTLAGYRADPRMDGGITFGMNAIVLEGVDKELRVGQKAQASFGF